MSIPTMISSIGNVTSKEEEEEDDDKQVKYNEREEERSNRYDFINHTAIYGLRI